MAGQTPDPQGACFVGPFIIHFFINEDEQKSSLFLYCCTQISSRVNLKCGSASTPLSLHCLVYVLMEKIRSWCMWPQKWFFFSLHQLFLARMGSTALTRSKSFTPQQALHPNHAFTATKQSAPLPAAHPTTANEQRTYANSLADSQWGGGKKKKKNKHFFGS